MEPFVHVPRIVAELDPGWTVAEHTQLTSPGGVVVTVSVSHTPHGVDAAGLAELDRVSLEAELSDLETTTADVAAFGGLAAREQRCSFTRDDVPHDGRVVYATVGDVALRAAASWPSGHPDAGDEVEAAVAGIRLLTRPLAVGHEIDEDAPAGSWPAPRPALDPAAWATIRADWADRDVADLDVGGTRWSPDELAVVATMLGAPRFPTVSDELLVALPEVGRQALVGAVAWSMLARGIVALEEGGAVLSEDVRMPFEVALMPDLVLEVERLTRDTRSTWWYGLRTDAAVRVSVVADGSREVSELDPGVAVADLVANADLAGRDAHADSSTIAAAELLGDGSGVAAVVRFRSMWRAGSTMVGGIVDLVEHLDGSLSSATVDETCPDGPVWALQPASSADARLEMLTRLPGA